ncbi:ribonuclease-III-like-domain-containing protein [Phanerochaete sordida]|uniref:Ribonuclease-III-like-domain-containing protein n=1 Tax=Phanerochaete sordida TaxID=48140 RepID=A0A9P3G000_9APHY|nr:ribonuclease-III-like-domain-containing protein [Phanerochaete sordida]
MSQIFTRGRILAHGITPRPATIVLNGLRQEVFRGRTLQHRSYARQHTAQPQHPRTSIDSAITELPDTSKLTQHLDRVFAPLQFPPELAARILTHQSHRHGVLTNNARLSFIGRRVLKSYLLLFIHSSSALSPQHDYDNLLDRVLNTYVLGEFVGPRWQLGKVMKWTPATQSESLAQDPTSAVQLGRDASRSIGLYKVEGTTVEALVGGVFHQFGGRVAHRLFHTRLLPHILLPGKPAGLPDLFHADALKICEQMGGPQADLFGTSSAPERP